MAQYNLAPLSTIDQTYEQGMLPQRNDKSKFYKDTSGRCDLSNFSLSSENRRILRKTEQYTYRSLPLCSFEYTPAVQKQIYNWIKGLGWDFPISSVKTIFNSHIFNQLDVWYDGDKVIAYSISYSSDHISHIAYVFYDPQYSHGDLPIRLVLQFVINSHDQHLKYCYLGRFSDEVGYYKRNMPGFEHFHDGVWVKFKK
ncbi:MAG: hypothetical protein WC657_06690 [Candidatus Paceibacterota bacterium]|jgi:arginyl-tRNA--protein-N-Asp/Glu arginylyltransferase